MEATEPLAGKNGHSRRAGEGLDRVDVRARKLMNLVGELVLARNQILQFWQYQGHCRTCWLPASA